MLTVAIHQPNFFPWLGYFHKLKNSDIFVFLDDVEFSKGSYINRSQVRVGGQAKWLTMPVKYRSTAEIRHTEIGSTDWRDKHLQILTQNYKGASFFDQVMPFVEWLYRDSEHRYVAPLNIDVITAIAKELAIDTQLVVASDIPTEGRADKKLCGLIKEVGGTRYLSGRGGRNYQSPETFEQAEIELIYTSFKVLPYAQNGAEFLAGLSILDALFNLGFDGVQQALA